MPVLSKVVGAVAIVLLFFCGTLLILDYLDPAIGRNRTRAQHARLFKSALENYYRAHGTYPISAGGVIDVLKKDLVDGGYLNAIPNDPSRSLSGAQYNYASDGPRYGILFSLEPESPGFGGNKPARTCTEGVRMKGTGVWNDPPDCGF